MMKKVLKLALVGAISIFAAAAIGCGGDDHSGAAPKKVDTTKPVIVGVNPGPHAQIMENVKKIAEKKGLKIETLSFIRE